MTFQLYTGIHPFKGRHPKYKPGDLDGRMTDSVSVFDPNVRVPKTCGDLSGIPGPHLAWYRSLFVDNHRSVPPFPDRLAVAVLTGVGRPDLNKKASFKAVGKNTVSLKAEVPGEGQVTAIKRFDSVEFFDANGNLAGKVHATGFTACNGNIYTINQDYLLENSFVKLGKVKHLARPVATVPGPAAKLFRGLAVVDIFGQKLFMVPYSAGCCTQIKIPELDSYRVIDAGREKCRCILIAEKDGRFERFCLTFDTHFSRYSVSVDHDIDVKELN